MAKAANAAVRESRRRSNPLDLERMNIMKALTAAEYSRRQFILNFAASKDTTLLIPGQKSAAVKAAEDWVTNWLAQNGYDASAVSSDFFKYTVDARLWSKHVGDDVPFPFAFMRKMSESSTVTGDSELGRPKSACYGTEQQSPQVMPMASPTTEISGSMVTQQPSKKASDSSRRQSLPAPFTLPVYSRRRSIKDTNNDSVDPLMTPEKDKTRSLSLNDMEDLKQSAKPIAQDKVPFFSRLGRSLSRRMSITAKG